MNLSLLKTICKTDSELLKRSLVKFLEDKYDKINIGEDFIYAEGALPVCLIAHVDTVFGYEPESFFYDPEQEVLWSPGGSGFDDRAGVYAILELIKMGHRPSVVFTDKEEVGGIGAYELVERFPTPAAPIKYIIELDRAGYDDCVFYSCNNPKFTDYIESFGFETHRGTFSDISIIAPAWGAAAVNLSVGYELEHTAAEYLMLEALDLTIGKVEDMLVNLDTAPEFEYIKDKKDRLSIFNTCICCNADLTTAHKNLTKYQGTDFYVCDNCFGRYNF